MNRFPVALTAATVSALALIAVAPVGAHAEPLADPLAGCFTGSGLGADEKAAVCQKLERSNGLVNKLRDAGEAVKDDAPAFVCHDKADPKTCQSIRMATTGAGRFWTFDYYDGKRAQCFSPGANSPYRVCIGGVLNSELWNGHGWEDAPYGDKRCNHFGGEYSADYLACEVALIPNSTAAK
jgi:hypothetical protein